MLNTDAGELHSYELMSEMYSVRERNPLIITSITILNRCFDGSAKNILGISMELEKLGTYLLNAIKSSLIDKEIFQPLIESLENISKFIFEHVRKKNGPYRKLDLLSIGCIVCKIRATDLVIVFANKKSRELGIVDKKCIGQSLKTIISPNQNGDTWKAIKFFAQNRLPCLECIVKCGNQSYKMLGHWLKNEAVFQLYNNNIKTDLV